MSDMDMTYGVSKALVKNAFTRNGYTFSGWATTSTGTKAYSDQQSVSNLSSESGKVVDLYAKWTPNQYAINFNANGGAGAPGQITATYDSSWKVPETAPKRPGYTFRGWSTSSTATSATYLANTSYSKNLTTGTTAQTLYAVWTANVSTKYTVKHWTQNLGAAATQNSSNYTVHSTDDLTGTTDSKVTPETKTINGFTVPAKQEVTIKGDGSLVVNYYYTRNTYKFTLNAATGVDTTGSTASGTYEYGATITLKAAAKPGYTLGAWTSSTKLATAPSGANGTFTMPIINVIMTPSATANTYTVEYNANGGTGTVPASQSCTYDTGFTTRANTLAKTGYTFAGWNTKSDGSGKSYGANTSQKNLATSGKVTLYAQWTPNQYWIRLDCTDCIGVAFPDIQATYGTPWTLPKSTPTRLGYTFQGWSTSPSATTVTHQSGMTYTEHLTTGTDNQKLYPVWKANANTNYAVKLWIQKPGAGTEQNDSNYELYEYYTLEGTTGESVTPAVKSITGFTAPSSKSIVITGDGKAVVEYYYTRNSYKFAIECDLDIPSHIATTGSSPEGTYQYGTMISLNNMVLNPFTFLRWESSTPLVPGTTDHEYYFNMPASDVTMTLVVTGGMTSLYLDAQGGTGDDVLSIQAGSKVPVPQDPVREDYEFKGWYKEPACVNAWDFENDRVPLDGLWLYAKWERTAYRVHFDANGGKGTMVDQAFNIGETKNLASNAFTREGYQFLLWSDIPDGEGTLYQDEAQISNLTEDMTLYAVWSENHYTVRFNANGGLGTMGNQSFAYDVQQALAKNAFTRNGYSFSGWATTSTGAKSYSDQQNVSNLTSEDGKVIDLYAKWTPVSYGIAYNLNGGANPTGAPTGYTVEQAVALPTPTKTGYTFGGWFTSSSFAGSAVTTIAKNSTGNKTFYAKWTPNEYWISYDANGGTTEVPGLKATYDVSYNLSSTVPERAGYTFAGWNTKSNGSGTSYSSGQSVKNLAEKDVFTLYAQWTAIAYSIHFNGNGATSGSMKDLAMTYGVAKNLTANGFSKTGCTFAGWATSPTGEAVYSDAQSVNNLLPKAGTVQLYAKWNSNSFNVTFDAHGGSTTPSLKADFGQRVTKPADPSRKGYTFLGWFKEEACENKWSFDNDTMPASALVLHAGWQANTYEVVFDANGGTGIMANEVFTYDQAKKLTKSIMERTGYRFKGWNTKADGSGTSYADEASVTNLAESGMTTLYAQWTASSYWISYRRNFPGMVEYMTSTTGADYDQDVVLEPFPLVFKVTGYTFTGWNTESDGSGTTYGDKATVRNLTSSGGEVKLYAQWRPNAYKIVFDGNGATGGETASLDMEYGAAKNLTKNGFERTGYSFAGWSKYKDGSGSLYQDEANVENLSSDDGKTITLYAKWTLMLSYQVPTSAKLSYDMATGSVKSDSGQGISSTSAASIKVSSISCEDLGAAKVFPDETDRQALLVSVQAGGGSASMKLGDSVSGDALAGFVVPAGSILPLTFGLTVPAGSKVDYLGEGETADLARLVYTIAPA